MREFNRHMSETNKTPFIVGKNALENSLIIKNAHQNDLWFHVAKGTSSHVILHHEFINRENITIAAQLCKSNSKVKNQNTVQIVYTPISNIKLTETPGSVIIKSNSNCKYIRV